MSTVPTTTPASNGHRPTTAPPAATGRPDAPNGKRRTSTRAKAETFASPKQPMAVARQLQPEWEHNGVLILRRWRGTWQAWDAGLWSERADADMRARLYQRMEHAQYVYVDGRSGISEPRPWAPARGTIGNLTEAIEAITNLTDDVEPGSWIDGRRRGGQVIPCENGLVDLNTRELIPHSAGYFNTYRVRLSYSPDAPPPQRWLEFLASVWPDDPDAIKTLQEIFGYILSGRRHLQKIVLIVGPTRSGKGTIARILTELVGASHVASPTLAGLGTNFGLAPLIGKTLAIVPDARMPRDVGGVVENLLMISGQDRINIDRKHRDAWIGQLPTQIMMLSNELPSLPDAAAAIVGRLLVLRMTRSFYGREDPRLVDDLLAELPGIFNWALDGFDRLDARGRFGELESSTEAHELLKETSSPVKLFIEEACVLAPDASVTADDLWTEWQRWCHRQGRDHVGTKASLAKNLFAAASGVRRTKPREYPGGPQVPTYQGIGLRADFSEPESAESVTADEASPPPALMD
ncbi:DNA primase family protein [Saccharopolyspora sp. NPDC000995]